MAAGAQHAALIAAGEALLTAFSLVGTAAGADTSIEISGLPIADGDLCLIFNRARGAALPADVTPSGFEKLRTVAASSSTRASIFARKLDGSETLVTGLDGSIDELWILLVLRPNAPFSSWVDHDAANNEGTTGNPAPQTINSGSAASLPALAYGQMVAAATAVSPRSTSPAMIEIAGASSLQYAHYQLYSAGDTPANHTYDMDDEDTNALQSGYLTFA